MEIKMKNSKYMYEGFYGVKVKGWKVVILKKIFFN
jgi:hypothetical protein